MWGRLGHRLLAMNRVLLTSSREQRPNCWWLLRFFWLCVFFPHKNIIWLLFSNKICGNFFGGAGILSAFRIDTREVIWSFLFFSSINHHCVMCFFAEISIWCQMSPCTVRFFRFWGSCLYNLYKTAAPPKKVHQRRPPKRIPTGVQPIQPEKGKWDFKAGWRSSKILFPTTT